MTQIGARQGRTKPLRLGLIGCGEIVRRSHLPGMLERPDLVRVAAVADVAEGSREAVGRAAGADPSQWYGDYREMLDKAALDVVSIATPHHLHASQVIAAAEAGLAVICEKPMATSTEEADAVLEAVARQRVAYSVVHNFLFAPATRAALELLREGEVGAPILGRAKSLFHKTDDQADATTVWRASAAAGGGCLNDTAYHEIYLVEAMVGSPVRLVEGRVETRFFAMDVDDIALLLCEHENGALSTVATSWGVPGSGAGETGNLCEVHGPRGSLRVVGRGRALHRCRREERRWEEVPVPAWQALSPAARERSGHAGFFAATLEALAGGTALPVPGEAACHNLAILEAARRASRERRAIAVEH
jgi:UDP-N-acetyl-2-amino-2-deoxyglucuronate dehydrogenase